jgi:hypothetical protein
MAIGAAASPSPAVLVARRRAARARAWNQKVRANVQPMTLEKLPFFCECGRDYCHHPVWLTLQEARDLIEAGKLIVGAHA